LKRRKGKYRQTKVLDDMLILASNPMDLLILASNPMVQYFMNNHTLFVNHEPPSKTLSHSYEEKTARK
jgi:hypothetical protein